MPVRTKSSASAGSVARGRLVAACAACALLALAACAPPPLTEAPDTGPGSDDADSPGVQDADSTDTTGADDDTEATDSSVPDGDTTLADSSMDGDADAADAVDPPPFSEVATIIGNSCAKTNCHGDPPGSGHEFLLGSNDPSESEIQSTLEGTTIDDPMAPMVEPGKPEESGLYQPLPSNTIENRTQMPLGGELADDKIETIRTWIAGGAPYE